MEVTGDVCSLRREMAKPWECELEMTFEVAMGKDERMKGCKSGWEHRAQRCSGWISGMLSSAKSEFQDGTHDSSTTISSTVVVAVMDDDGGGGGGGGDDDE